jgi:hypothetical protein
LFGYCVAAILDSHAGVARGQPEKEATMQAQAIPTPITAPRGQSELARARAIVRFNSVMFHGLAAASLLESAVPLHAERLDAVLAAQPEARLWLEQVWVAQRTELGRRLREYVEATWPEFDWNAAYAEFAQPCRARAGIVRRRPVALEALRLCVWETLAAVFYRGLARAADEAGLRALAREGAAAHAAFFDYFRGVHEHCKRREPVGFAATWRAPQAVCRSLRELHMRAAFEALPQNWKGPRTVPELPYGEFVQRLVQLVQRHAGIGRVEQFLFRPWLRIERAAPAAPTTAAVLALRPVSPAAQAA